MRSTDYPHTYAEHEDYWGSSPPDDVCQCKDANDEDCHPGALTVDSVATDRWHYHRAVNAAELAYKALDAVEHISLEDCDKAFENWTAYAENHGIMVAEFHAIRNRAVQMNLSAEIKHFAGHAPYHIQKMWQNFVKSCLRPIRATQPEDIESGDDPSTRRFKLLDWDGGFGAAKCTFYVIKWGRWGYVTKGQPNYKPYTTNIAEAQQWHTHAAAARFLSRKDQSWAADCVILEVEC